MTEYSDIRAINWSTLRHMRVSPLMYRWRLDNPERKPSYVLGGAIHCAILEPGKLDSRYAVFDGRRAGKAWDEWQAEHPGVESLKPDEMERAQRCVAAVRLHRVASRLLSGVRVEETITWVDPDTNLACKGRADAISPAYVVDLKSARDPAPRAFSRAVAEYGLHAQVALYTDGATLAGKIDGKTPPYFIAVQSDEPFDCSVFQLTPETLTAGRALYRSLLRRLVQCIDSDFWPGVAPDLEPLDLPPWADGASQGSLTEEDF